MTHSFRSLCPAGRFATLLLGALGLALAGCDATEEPVYRADPVITRPVDFHPDWSPDGRSIAYTHWAQTDAEQGLGTDRHTQQVWVLELDRDERRFVTPGAHPVWSPDGSRIAFTRDATIWIHDLASGTEALLFDCGESYYPAWSRDGQTVAFESTCETVGGKDIWLVDPNTAQTRALGDGSEGERLQPSFAPDGSVAVSAYVGASHPEIVILGTHSPFRVTSNDRRDAAPAFSPSGSRIAWHSFGSAGDYSQSGVWVMRADGSRQRLVAHLGAHPAWSPDGMQIAFYGAIIPPGPNPIEETGLFRVNLSTGRIDTLTTRADYLDP